MPDARLRILNDKPIDPEGRFVIYWMQQSQRTRFNHALERAIVQANALDLPLLVVFGIMDNYPEANERHYAFMLQGLTEVSRRLGERKIKFIMQRGAPQEVALHYAPRAALLVCDRGYLRHQKLWREEVAARATCRVEQVESDVVVPVEVVSDKAEYAARTIRPKIHRHLRSYLKSLGEQRVRHSSLKLKIQCERIQLDDLKIDRGVSAVSRFRGGESSAQKLLNRFVREKIRRYEAERSEPSASATSMLSPYLHFGQISPLQVALSTRSSATFLEELIVRRELAMNFVHYTSNYDRYDCLPAWAQRTLKQHRADERAYVYSPDQLERAATHDRWWNAAQTEMLRTGYMHNYMRMYWGKKILEWSKTPEQAYETALRLNNRYFLDGRDPSSYANVAWIFGLHDRPWAERPIFGQIRYMNAAGLERKFDMEAYERIALGPQT
jgi:deoxyribodipyrimidine photo-lyase